MTLIVVLAACAVGTAVLVLLVRRYLGRWVDRVEHGDDELPVKVHRLQRMGVFAVLASMALLLVAAWGPLAVWTSSHPHQKGTPVPASTSVAFLGLFFFGFACYLVVILAVTRTLRPPMARLRRVPVKVEHRLRAGLVGGAFGLAFVVLWSVLRALVPAGEPWHTIGFVGTYAVALFAIQALMAPLFLVALRAERLPEPCHQRLMDLADELGVRVRDIRRFPGRSQRVANAVQVGVLPRLRYILLSDYLLENMDDDEVDAVTAHELGHARGHHVAIKIGGFVLTYAAILAPAAVLGALVHGWAAVVAGVVAVVAFPVAFVVAQGFIGLRLEEAADDVAAREVGLGPITHALEHLADLNDTVRRPGRGWELLTQHPGIDERIERLERAEGERRVA